MPYPPLGPGGRVLTGDMDPRRGLRGDDDESGITGTELVHVWERIELASCAEELQVWERRDEMAENVRMWCSGPVVDWDLVAEASGFVGTAQCRGSCNPAHWWWRHTLTDRSFQPTLLSDHKHAHDLLHDVVRAVPACAHFCYWQ